MTIKRETLKFMVPVSVFGIKSNNLEGRKLIPCYLSPDNFSINESKIIKENITKGGYVVEYWGEELPKIEASGTTGSGGIEAIEILRSIYRNEQIQMKELLERRSRLLSQAIDTELKDTSSATLGAGIAESFDILFSNAYSEIKSGTQSVIDEITNIWSEQETNPQPANLIPSLGSFAVSVDLYLQGVKYRGYFTRFNVKENSESQGLFSYDFGFHVTKRSGVRNNFMPWHRSPVDLNGDPVEASIPIEGPRPEELSYPYGRNFQSYNQIVSSNGLSTFVDATAPQFEEPNNVGVSRFNKART